MSLHYLGLFLFKIPSSRRQFSIQMRNALFLSGDLGLVIDTQRLQRDELFLLASYFFGLLLIKLGQVEDVLSGTPVLRLDVTVQRMQTVQLGLKL